MSHEGMNGLETLESEKPLDATLSAQSMAQLNARLRAIQFSGLIFIVLTAVVWLLVPVWRVAVNGLLLGELGGAYVVISMIRQGHLNDNTQGTALFASGMAGTFTRLAVLAAVMVVSLKLKSTMNPYTALVGYLLGFVFIFAGLYGYARNQRPTPQAK
jgi:hypothetical protein